MRKLLLMSGVLLVASVLATPASAVTGATFTVTNVLNSGAGSLRDAITAADTNANAPAVDHIVFAIPGNGPFVIPLTGVLPSLAEPVVLDGYTQGDATPGTPADDARPNDEGSGSSNAVLKITVNGAGAGSAFGIVVDAPDTTVRGLNIENFSGEGILVNQGLGTHVEGNFIGTNVGGTAAQGNASGGIGINTPDGSGLVIGGTSPAARNIISGNGFQGIDFGSSGDRNVTIQGNLIGVGADGATAIGNTGPGILVRNTPKSGFLIGGTASGAANVIANNTAAGVEIDFGGSGTRVLSNSIHDNSTLGIDIDGDGITANDHKDPDGGTNHLQNFPVITPTPTVSGGIVTIKGFLDSRPNTKFLLQFFSNDSPDPSSFGEAQVFLGNKTVLTNGAGHASFSAKFPVPVGGVDFVASTATNLSTRDTSELSTAVHIP